MDLKSALTWSDEVEQALERLLGVVRPRRDQRRRPRSPHAEGRSYAAGADVTVEAGSGEPGSRTSGDEVGELVEQRGLGLAPTICLTTSPFW